MKNKKTEFHFYTISEWEQEQDYLRDRHKKGWKFVNVTFPGFYHFEKCEPEDMIYQLDYNRDGIEHKAEYVQMFKDCGWEYIMDFVGYSYFRKPVCEMKVEENIFCDTESRVDMIKRVFKGRVIPLIIIFFAIIVPQLFFQSSNSEFASEIIFWIFAALAVLYVYCFSSISYKFIKLLQRRKK